MIMIMIMTLHGITSIAMDECKHCGGEHEYACRSINARWPDVRSNGGCKHDTLNK